MRNTSHDKYHQIGEYVALHFVSGLQKEAGWKQNLVGAGVLAALISGASHSRMGDKAFRAMRHAGEDVLQGTSHVLENTGRSFQRNLGNGPLLSSTPASRTFKNVAEDYAVKARQHAETLARETRQAGENVAANTQYALEDAGSYAKSKYDSAKDAVSGFVNDIKIKNSK